MMKLVIFVVACMVLGVSCLNEVCDKDKNCNEANNERCQKFDACKMGYCVCKEGYSRPRQSGGIDSAYTNVCMKALKVGASCNNQTTKGACGSAVNCVTSGSCVCVGTMYSATTDLYSCKRNDLKGSGSACTNNFDCSGGTTCGTSVCQCGEGSSWDSTRKVCMHTFTEKGLGEGERCTGSYSESSEYSNGFDDSPQQLCKEGMDCNICPEETYKSGYNKYTCMKSAFGGASSVQINAAVIFIVSAVATLRFL